MSGLRSEVLDWFDSGRVEPGRAREVLRTAGLVPSPTGWRTFLSQLSLWLGTIALVAAIIFFFAFNWDELGRFAKFGLVEAAIVAGLAASWAIDLDGPPGKALLTLLSLLAGALLALTGQIYQTGADTFELFLWWALLILPWVLVGRFSPLWLVWLALADLAAFFYFQRGWDPEPLAWSLFGLNSLAVAAWEAGHRAGLSWLSDSWPPRLAAIAAAFFATALMFWAIFDARGSSAALATLAYVAWLGLGYVWYRRVRPDLFMLAAGLLSLIVTVAALLSDTFLDGSDAGGFLLVGLAVIGMSAGGAIWLRAVAREQGL